MKFRLLKKIKQASNIYTFEFESNKRFRYLPGQYVYITLPWLKNDYRGPTRHFTLSSSPTEANIMITTNIRKRSQFKRSLFSLQKGDEIEADGPTGTFILDENEVGEHVLIAGGIGITPFRSFVKYTVDKDLEKNFLNLIYSTKSLKNTPFKDELDRISNQNSNIDVNLTFTEESPKNWKGLTGRVDKNMLEKIINEPKNKKFWLCGPPKMVTAMENVLDDMEIENKNIILEKFTGY